MAVHTVPTPDPDAERRRDIGWVLGLLGLAVLAFSTGRATAAPNKCCDQLLHRDNELILCETRLNGQPFNG